MLSYCLNKEVSKTKNKEIMLLSKYSVCNSKKSRSIKQPIKNQNSNQNKCIKISNIINKFSLAADKFMPEMHLRQPEFLNTTCRAFPKNKTKI